VTLDDVGWGKDGPQRAWYEGPAVYAQPGLLQFAKADIEPRPGLDLPLGVFAGVGVVSYAMGPEFHVLDLLGLADALTAHLDGSQTRSVLAGHEKALPAPWIAALLTPLGSRPDPAAFTMGHDQLLAPTTGRAFQEQVAWARAALRCDEIRDIREASAAPLMARRFADNVFRSFDNTRLRVPPDPEDAYHRFCGSGVPPEVQAARDG
jgi:hypothetical protein